MITTCPTCGKDHDVSLSKITDWLEKSEPGRKAVASFLGRFNQQKAKRGPNPNNSRGSDGARKAAEARWKGHVKKGGKE